MHYWLTPLIQNWGAPLWLADAVGFVLALAVVTFLHLVIGEMAPKSLALAHPERTATILAIPMRTFMTFTRPVLTALNHAANWCVRKLGVEPVDELKRRAGSGCVAASRRTFGDRRSSRPATLPQPDQSLELDHLTVGDIVSRTAGLRTIDICSDATEIQRQSQQAHHQRILFATRTGASSAWCMSATALRLDTGSTAGVVMRPVLRLTADTPVYRALQTMRHTRNHLALIVDDGTVAGLITLTDVLRRLLPDAAICRLRSVRAVANAADTPQFWDTLRLLAKSAEGAAESLLEHFVEATVGVSQILSRPFLRDELGG